MDKLTLSSAPQSSGPLSVSQVLADAVTEVCERMCAEVEAVGLILDPCPTLGSADARWQVDPFDHSSAVQVRWVERKELLGSVQVREDGGIYGEYFVTRPHPHNPTAFIEAVVVWGKVGTLRSELRLVFD